MADLHAAIFFRLDTDPVVRLWAGVGNFVMPQDTVETELDAALRVYRGAGELLDIPALQQMINGLAERLTFGISGVSAEAMRLAEEEAAEVRGARVNIGLGFLDRETLQLVPPVTWLWEGEADTVPVSKQDGTRTIGISVGTINTDRKRPTLDTYTPVIQRRRSPTDAFCDFVPLYNAGSTKKWA